MEAVVSYSEAPGFRRAFKPVASSRRSPRSMDAFARLQEITGLPQSELQV